ncbi:MAG: anti-sigma factor family protein [Telluria sp.]
MSFSDDILMAYADGELGEPERSLVERAEREDPAVAAAIERHRALRADVFAAFAGVLDEPVPARLQATVAGAGRVSSLDAARARKMQAREAAEAARALTVRERSWPRWGALAASLAVGVLAGSVWLGGGAGGNDAGFAALDGNGRLLARGELAGALSQQLASTAQQDKRVQIGVSFATRDGSYCRSFKVSGSAGLACREGDSWRIPVLRDAPADAAAYRQAASASPAAVLEAIDERIDGAALDAAAERTARDRDWKR